MKGLLMKLWRLVDDHSLLDGFEVILCGSGQRWDGRTQAHSPVWGWVLLGIAFDGSRGETQYLIT